MTIYEISQLSQFFDKIALSGDATAVGVSTYLRFALYTKIELENIQKRVNSSIEFTKGNVN